MSDYTPEQIQDAARKLLMSLPGSERPGDGRPGNMPSYTSSGYVPESYVPETYGTSYVVAAKLL